MLGLELVQSVRIRILLGVGQMLYVSYTMILFQAHFPVCLPCYDLSPLINFIT